MNDPRPAAPEPAMQILGRHGIDCPKVLHIGKGYLHSHDYDGPYYVDGILYCGRCHRWMETEAVMAESTTPNPKTMRDTLATRLRDHAALHDDLARHSDEQRQWGDDLRAAADELEERDLEIMRLQRALAFWLPGVPADDPEVAQRAGDDAHLLAGYQDYEIDAEDLGWIRLREAP